MAAEAYDHNDNIVTHNNSLYPHYDQWNQFEYHSVQRYWLFDSISIVCPIVIFVGVFTNILAFVVLVKSRLWLKHEGYVYLAANFCANVAVLLFCTSSFWLTFDYGWGYHLAATSNFVCKMWHFLMSILFASGWLSVALLFNVYLREHLMQRRRCGYPMFAAKYCTLFASTIIVGVIFSVLFVLGIPYLAIYKISAYDECNPSSEYVNFRVLILVEWIVMWVLPIVFFLPIILLITLCTKRKSNNVGFSQIDERSGSDEQMRVMALTMSSMTLFSQIVWASIRYAYQETMVARVVVEMALALFIAFQPILCFFILKALRDGFRSRCCRRPVPSLDREEEVVQLSAIQEDPSNATES